MSNETSRGRVLILGIDGATFDIIDPLVAQGRLPNLARLMGGGVSAPLRSTQPCQSSVAWPAFMTGKNPGKNGVYAFWEADPGQVIRPLISYPSIQAATIWEILSERGHRVGSVNLPVTFPPPEVNGTMVAGLLTPSVETRFTHPPELHAELLAQVGSVPLDMDLMRFRGKGQDLEFLDAAYRTMEARTRITQYLMDRDPDWDVFMCTWTITDRVQHFFWKYMDEAHPIYATERGEKLRDVIRQCYIRVDAEVGKLLERVDLDRDTVVVVSDHGFGPKRKNVYLNHWLEGEGLFRFKRPYGLRKWRPMPRVVSLGGVLARLGMRGALADRLRRFRVPLAKLGQLPAFMMIDWSKTKAYNNFIGSEEGIYVNLKGREPHGCVEPGAEYEAVRDQIIAGLSALVDPEDGLPVCDRIDRREDLYHGPHLELAPDLVVTMREHSYMPGATLRTGELFRSTADPDFAGGEQEGESGQHRDHGVFVMAGGVATDRGHRLDEAEIIDVAPTVLYVLAEGVPSDMDGSVVEAGIRPEVLAARPVVKVAATEKVVDQADSGVSHTQEEEDLVKERLKSLGYFG